MIVSPFQSIVYQLFPACGGSTRPRRRVRHIAACRHKFVALRLNKSSASTIKVTTTYIQSRSSAKANTENATRATGVAIRIRIPSWVMAAGSRAVLDEVGNSGGEDDDSSNRAARAQEDANDPFGALV